MEIMSNDSQFVQHMNRLGKLSLQQSSALHFFNNSASFSTTIQMLLMGLLVKSCLQLYVVASVTAMTVRLWHLKVFSLSKEKMLS